MNNLAFQIYGSTKSGIFQSTWKTDNAGTSASNQIELPLLSGGTYNFWIDWGDGSTTNVTSYSQRTHTYASAGTYTVRATGAVGIWRFADGGDKLKILTISSWGKLELGFYTFGGCSNLTLSGINDVPDLSTVNSFYLTFSGCSKITTIGRVNEWNTSTITNMEGVFGSCALFNSNISNWIVSNVTLMISALAGCTLFNNGYASGVVNQLPWNTSTCTNMNGMFAYCPAFNSNLGIGTTPWDVNKVTTFSSMFQGATNFNNGNNSAPINNWNINTISSVSMVGMFNNTSMFNQDISSWNVSQVTTMGGMFAYASVFNQPLTNWERIGSTLANVTNMENMFLSCPSFNQSIGNWNISSVTNFADFMLSKTPATYSSTNLDAIYNGWIVNGVKPNINISFGGAKYTAAGAAGRALLAAPPNGTGTWTITDGGQI